jgi:HK97 family phage prohead protease
MRTYAAEDIRVLSRADGYPDGRTVEAYAAVFGQQAEIHDDYGDYFEVIDPQAFRQRLAQLERSGLPQVKVLFNHGMTIHGTPSERGSMPVGVPVSITADSRGLLTRTLYNKTPLAEEVLEGIRSGAITAQSFTGSIIRSDPPLLRSERYRPKGGRLPVVRRLALGLREYGPCPFPAYSGAAVVGVRSNTHRNLNDDPDLIKAALTYVRAHRQAMQYPLKEVVYSDGN